MTVSQHCPISHHQGTSDRTWGNCLQLCKGTFTLSIRENFFTEMVLVVAFPPLEVFKRRVGMVLEAMFQWWACRVKLMAELDDLMCLFFFHPNWSYVFVTFHCTNPPCGQPPAPPVAARTKSHLMATRTPTQLRPMLAPDKKFLFS